MSRKAKNLDGMTAEQEKNFKKFSDNIVRKAEILAEMNSKETKGFKKLNNYLAELVKTDLFQNRIKELRKEYDITVGYKDPYGKYPPFIPPEEFQKTDNAQKHFNLMRDIQEFSNKLGLYTHDWYEIIWIYLFRNEIKIEEHTLMYGYDLCRVKDVLGDLELVNDPNIGVAFQSLMDAENLEFPVAIAISPYASQRDIVDFIKKKYYMIRKFQQHYQNKAVKIGSIKTKNPKKQERNKFIYENKDLSLEETKKLVEEKFGECLDYEYIGKIRSYEAKRRKEL